MERKPTVGLTGGIASGKSTVAGFFRELVVPVVDADAIAREVVAKGSDGLAEVVAAFGREVLTPEGALDRKKLAAVVFGDDQARARLNAITHPRIASLSAQQIAALADHPAPYVIYEAALLVENRLHEGLAALVVVAVDEETQLRRLAERDGLDEAEARARLAAQLPLDQKVSVADFVVQNEGSLQQTRDQVRETHRALIDRFGGTK